MTLDLNRWQKGEGFWKGEEPTYKCRDCWDTNWVDVGPPEKNTVKPCHRCTPDVYQRWVKGCYLPSNEGRVYDKTIDQTDRDKDRFGGRR